MCFLNRFIDVSCLPHYCANGMIPWPGFPNKCFRVNKKEVMAISKSGSKFCHLVKMGDEVTCGTVIQEFSNVHGPTGARCEYGKLWSVFINQCVEDFIIF